MNFWSKLEEGWNLTQSSFMLARARPVFFIPIFFCWVIVCGIVLYFRYYWVPSAGFWFSLFEIFLAVFCITYTVCISNIVMLELVQAPTPGETRTLPQALFETLTRDSLKVIPIAVMWAIVWFVLALIEVLISFLRKKAGSTSSPDEPSIRDAAITIGDLKPTPFSWVGLGFDIMHKLIRLVSFLSLPGIAWRNLGPFASIKAAFTTIKEKPMQFLTIYTLTSAASLIMALPLIPIALAVRFELPIPNIVWTCVLFYEAIIWTFSIYLEQMTMGLLYLKNQDSSLFVGQLDSEVNTYMAHVQARVLANQEVRPPYEVLVGENMDVQERNTIRENAHENLPFR